MREVFIEIGVVNEANTPQVATRSISSDLVNDGREQVVVGSYFAVPSSDGKSIIVIEEYEGRMLGFLLIPRQLLDW